MDPYGGDEGLGLQLTQLDIGSAGGGYDHTDQMDKLASIVTRRVITM